MAQNKDQVEVLVAGDVVTDVHLYEGERFQPGRRDKRGVWLKDEAGGAEALFRLLQAVAGGARNLAMNVSMRSPPGVLAAASTAFGVWKPAPSGLKKTGPVWRAALLGYGERCPGRAPARPQEAASAHQAVDVFVVDDADLGFRTEAGTDVVLDGILTGNPKWIVLKTTAPLSRGDLWRRITRSRGGRTICIMSCEDLRQEHSGISRGLSWERSLTDLATALSGEPFLAALAVCRYLVICFSVDGALLIDHAGGTPKATLVFDPGGIEGQFLSRLEGGVTGYLSCMAASVALWAAGEPGTNAKPWPSLAFHLEMGLVTMRNLATLGHGEVNGATADDDKPEGARPDGFPYQRLGALMSKIHQEGVQSMSNGEPARVRPSKFAQISMPWSPQDVSPGWTLLIASQTPPGFEARQPCLGLARLLVTHGADVVLAKQPHAAFGKLTAIDWREIESLRGIRKSMSDYQADPAPRRPLSIGVFGPPGAGKSFGVKQIAKEIFGDRGWLEFNLSQFEKASDLMGPFHEARDLVLDGVTPVVFWDEFDAANLKWLQYLLAPMQDGKFQEGQLTHATGKAVYIFAGGTRPSFAAFSSRSKESGTVSKEEAQVFCDRKGPDFVSRLDAYLDVMGPNPNPVADGGMPDLTFPIRRAKLLRNFLAEPEESVIAIDSDLLNALLLVPEYRHGSRSLEKLAAALKTKGGMPIRRSRLPPREILDLSVDAAAFEVLLDCNTGFRNDQEVNKLAEKIHDLYLQYTTRADEAVASEIDRPYEKLDSSEQEDNRAAARRTVDVLALIGMGVAKRPGVASLVTVEEFEAHAKLHIERLAEAEHDGWMAHRKENGWKRGPERKYSEREHPCLVAYADLDDANRAKDRAMVMDYMKRVTSAGFDLVWLRSVSAHDPLRPRALQAPAGGP